jgi:glutamate 5-kinase
LAGDAVDLIGMDGVAFARGLVAFDSAELPMLLGRKTGELSAEHGEAFGRELVHRDDLVLLAPPKP